MPAFPYHFPLLFSQYYIINLYLSIHQQVLRGFTLQNTKESNIACWMFVLYALYGKRTEVWLLHWVSTKAALSSTLYWGENTKCGHCWTDRRWLQMMERHLPYLSLESQFLLTLQCPLLKRKSCHGRRAALRTRLDWWGSAKLRSGWRTSRTCESSAVERWNADAIHCNKGK